MVIQTKCLAVQSFNPPPAPLPSPSLRGGLWDAAAAAEVCHGLIALRPAPLFTGGNAERVQVANMHTKIKGGTCTKKGCTLTRKKNTRHHSHDSPITKQKTPTKNQKTVVHWGGIFCSDLQLKLALSSRLVSFRRGVGSAARAVRISDAGRWIGDDSVPAQRWMDVGMKGRLQLEKCCNSLHWRRCYTERREDARG